MCSFFTNQFLLNANNFFNITSAQLTAFANAALEPVREMTIDAYLEAKATGTLGKHSSICRVHLGDRTDSEVAAYVLPPSAGATRWPAMYGNVFLPNVYLHRTDKTSMGGFNLTFR